MTTMPAHHPSVTQPPPGSLPEEPTKQPFARRAMAGYVLSRTTALRLCATLTGRDIARPPRPPLGAQTICNPITIENAIIEYMTTKRPEWKGKRMGKVVVTYTGLYDAIETIIITQGCLLTKAQRLNSLLPVGTEGEREDFIREWLESNGVNKGEYTWVTREDRRDLG